MTARLESVARRPVLRSLLKTLIVAFGVYFFRQRPLLGTLLLFLTLFFLIYFRPPFNSRKFLVSALGLLTLPVLLPPMGVGLGWILLVLWAGAFFLLLGVKNLILLRRQGSYELIHFLIVTGLGALYLLDLLGFVPQIILFFVLFFLFREFYFVLAPHYPQRLTLAAATLSLLLVEVAWILSFLPINFLAGAAFIALISFLFHDLILHHLQGTLNRQIVLRNVTLFVALSTILMVLPGQ